MTLTAAQVRQACAVLRWGSPVPAERSDIPYAVICSVWADNSLQALSETDRQEVRAILEAAGVEFTSEKGSEADVRLRQVAP